MSEREYSTENKKALLRLKELRRSKGLSLHALAEKTGVNHQKIGRAERGETQMTVDMLNRLTKVLEVPISEIIEEQPDLESANEKPMSELDTQLSVSLIPMIYDRLDELCSGSKIEVDSSVKVHISTVIFKAIQDIRTSVKNDEALVEVLIQVFDAIFGRLFLTEAGEQDFH